VDSPGRVAAAPIAGAGGASNEFRALREKADGIGQASGEFIAIIT
jgi:hypothetical protein